MKKYLLAGLICTSALSAAPYYHPYQQKQSKAWRIAKIAGLTTTGITEATMATYFGVKGSILLCKHGRSCRNSGFFIISESLLLKAIALDVALIAKEIKSLNAGQ